MNAPFPGGFVGVALMLWVTALASLAPEPAIAQPGGEPAAIMRLDEVRIGMKGYGLTVFHGTQIEPFPVEVVSIVSNAQPKRGVIWIRCTDPRLEKSGPVQGMSGSPIYLWDEGQTQQLGKGGRLIGAFAFGYSLVKECLAGVQPIELMREVGANVGESDGSGGAAGGDSSGGWSGQSLATMQQLRRMADANGYSAARRFRLDAVEQLTAKAFAGAGVSAAHGAERAVVPGPMSSESGAKPMLLPMSVGSAELARWVSPLLEPMGLSATAGGAGLVSGRPPTGIDAEGVALEPGSVLSIPLAFGDLDLAAAGTVTDVLPDGTVLAFGHPMFGQGATALPMATGYVHFVVPMITTSFKQTGSLNIRGSIVQDQASAVAGIAERRFTTAPVEVGVRMAGWPERTYHYEVVDHPSLTPILAAIVALQSTTAQQGFPMDNTLHLRGQMTFSNGRTLRIDSQFPGASEMDLLFELLPPIAVLMDNPYEKLKLSSLELAAEIEPRVNSGSLVQARLDKAEVAPGDAITLTVQVQPYGKRPVDYRARLEVPQSLPEGDYQILIADASTYMMTRFASRPHLFITHSVDDLADTLSQIMGIRTDRLYIVMQLPEQGLAIGREELPRLPSSRQAMIDTPTSTLAARFTESTQTTIDTGMVVDGQLGFTVSVRKKMGAATQPAVEANEPVEPVEQ